MIYLVCIINILSSQSVNGFSDKVVENQYFTFRFSSVDLPFKEYGMLPMDTNFIEFSEELYENYYEAKGKTSSRLFLLIPIDFSGKEKGEIEGTAYRYRS